MSRMEDLYDPLLAETRDRLTSDPMLAKLASPDVDPTTFHRFLIEYSARSVAMTEPVDSWIRRAGERCNEIGLPTIGAELEKHAHHEEGHHLMLIEDTKNLVELWNRNYPTVELDSDQLIAQSVAPATQAYIDLHEEVIKNDYPFAQVAIELEIEGLALSWAPEFVANVKRVLGDQIHGKLSFLHEHIAIDIGHTAFNRRLMNNLLELRADDVERIADTGKRALNIYLDFLGQVWTQVTTKGGAKSVTSNVGATA